jgi:hypothetical protein
VATLYSAEAIAHRSSAHDRRRLHPRSTTHEVEDLLCLGHVQASGSLRWRGATNRPAPFGGTARASAMQRHAHICMTLPMRRSQLCALKMRDRTNAATRTTWEALPFLRIVFGDTRRRTARFPLRLRLRFREPRSLIAAMTWQTDLGPIGEAWNAGARAIGRALQRRRAEDRRPERQPASGIARCFATQKVRENYVKGWLAASP